MKQYLSIITLAAISLLAASGCRKDDLQVKDDTGGLISFAVNQSNYWNNNAADSETKSTYLGEMELTNERGESISVSMSSADSIETNHSDMSDTKGAMITSKTLADDKIGVEAYIFNNDVPSIYFSDEFAQIGTDHNYTQGSTGAGCWAPSDNSHVYYWPKAAPLDFWAWAPLTAINNAITGKNSFVEILDFKRNVTSSSKSLSFTYDLGDGATEGYDASSQPDLMFSSHLAAIKSDGHVKLDFKHALAAVQFKVISAKKGATVNEIKLVDVARKGDCKFFYREAAPFEWANNTVSDANKSTYGFEFDTHIAADTASDFYTSQPEANFMMIPQALGTQSISISIKIDDDSAPVTFVGKIPTTNIDKWEAGKTYVYTINIDDVVSVTVTDQMETEDGKVTKKNIKTINTGSATAYLRAAVTAVWCSDNDNFAVRPFNGTLPTPSANWLDGGDGYYYYKYPVKGGNETNGVIFESFTSPTDKPLAGCHLEMQILLQGVKFDKDKARVSTAWGSTIANMLSNDPETPTTK